MSNTSPPVIVIPSEYDQILDQLAETSCPRCLGTQAVPAMSDNGPDAHEVDVCCDHCDGDGTGRGAYKTLAAFYGKARTELTQLRYYHWHTKQLLEKQAAASAWQPIEGAPQDGRTMLLGYPNQAGKWRTVRGQWMSADYIADNWEDPDSGEPGWYETAEEAEDIPNCWRIHPTHFMALPGDPRAAVVQAPATVSGSQP